ncbi:MAG: hypothetical protein DRR08_12965 [Candidatus Parabeggiatoa sp. nov. 2]|nr:MAG: hypothetical protein B6247_18245 [Beggiatoa sp. 4572_84]RKZ59818.1 MAG: hypothetical protein DRR08_12965 [Gammaproteobacteria bacterium]
MINKKAKPDRFSPRLSHSSTYKKSDFLARKRAILSFGNLQNLLWPSNAKAKALDSKFSKAEALDSSVVYILLTFR